MRAALLAAAASAIAVTLAVPTSAEATPTACSDLEIIAHRGYHPARVDENSLTAFREAASRGYSIETDVWPDAQGKLWVFHDRDVYRATGVHGYINQMTSAQVAALRYKKAGSPLPTLAQAVAVWASYPSTRVYIEVKVQPAVAGVATAVRNAGLVNRVYISSFTTFVHRTQPDLNLLLKSYGTTPDPTTLRSQGIDAVAFQPGQITTSTMDRYHAAGVEVQDRDTNSSAEWRSVIAAGGDAILTDMPDALKQFCPSV